MAQNIDNKKTTLDDNAAIYQRTQERTEGKSFAESWRNLDRKGKWQYFKDYMLKTIIIAVLVVVGLFFLARNMIKNNTKTAYSIYNVEYGLDKSSTVAELEALDKKWNLSEKEIIEYEDGMNFAHEGSTILTHMAAGSVDAIIGTTDELKNYGRYFCDLSECMPEVYDKIPDEAKAEMTFMMPRGDGSGITDETTKVVGIRLSKTILGKYISNKVNYIPDSLVIFFVYGGVNNVDKNYDDDVAKLLLGLE